MSTRGRAPTVNHTPSPTIWSHPASAPLVNIERPVPIMNQRRLNEPTRVKHKNVKSTVFSTAANNERSIIDAFVMREAELERLNVTRISTSSAPPRTATVGECARDFFSNAKSEQPWTSKVVMFTSDSEGDVVSIPFYPTTNTSSLALAQNITPVIGPSTEDDRVNDAHRTLLPRVHRDISGCNRRSPTRSTPCIDQSISM